MSKQRSKGARVGDLHTGEKSNRAMLIPLMISLAPHVLRCEFGEFLYCLLVAATVMAGSENSLLLKSLSLWRRRRVFVPVATAQATAASILINYWTEERPDHVNSYTRKFVSSHVCIHVCHGCCNICIFLCIVYACVRSARMYKSRGGEDTKVRSTRSSRGLSCAGEK